MATNNILDLPRDQFLASLNELAAQGVNTDELVRQYRRANSPFSGLFDWAINSERDIANEGRTTAGAGLFSKEAGTTGMDALASTRIEPANFIAGLLSGGAQAVDAAGATLKGLVPAADMPMEALGTAGMAMTGGAASMGRGVFDYDPNTARIFAGPNSNTANLDALARARELSARRKSPDEIWNETGWFKGADGMWRYEIDDSMAVLRQEAADALNYGDAPYQTNYSGALLHQPLLGGSYRGVEYKPAYDLWGDMDFERAPQASGWHDRDTSAIGVKAPSAAEGLPVTLHELQHAIQSQEGFAVGSNPAFEKSVLEALGAVNPDDAAFQNYLRTAGEVEANNVMNRRTMTADERRATPPWLTQDFPNEEQIVRLPETMRSLGLLGGYR